MDMPQAYGLPARTLTDALSSEERDRVRCRVDWHHNPSPLHKFATQDAVTEHGERALTPTLSQRAREERYCVCLGGVCWARAAAVIDRPWGLMTRGANGDGCPLLRGEGQGEVQR